MSSTIDPAAVATTLAGGGGGGEGSRPEHSARVAIEAEVVARYSAAGGETQRQYLTGELAPPMFAAVYAAAAVWPVVLAVADGRGPLLHFAQQFEWGVPVRRGDVITTHAWAEGTERRAGNDFHTFASCSRNQHDEEVSRGSWTILITGSAA